MATLSIENLRALRDTFDIMVEAAAPTAEHSNTPGDPGDEGMDVEMVSLGGKVLAQI
jgi:hypothetical protein